MRNTIHLLLLVSILPCPAVAQNLVPNPSFEEYTECPTGYGPYEGMERATEWYYMLGGPELYNVCDAGDTAGVPNNWVGYQIPASGDGYMGMWAFSNCECPYGLHEIVGVRLTQPLEVGQTYWASVKVSWTSGFPNLDAYTGLASNRMGLLCRMDSVGQGFGLGGWEAFPNYAQVSSQAIITDSVGWTTIAGSFVADSAYQWLYVGNFYGDDQTQFVVVDPGGDQVAYYYVDDVCLAPVQGYCAEAVGLPEVSSFNLATGSIDVAQGTLFLEGLPEDGSYDLGLFDLQGRAMRRAHVSSIDGKAVWHDQVIASLNGIYILRLRGGRGEWSLKLPALTL